MSDPSDEELERAERIRKLRSGAARSRGHEVRERRRDARDVDEASEREATSPADADAATESSTGSETADDDESGESPDGPGPIPGGGQVDVLELAAGLPDDGSLFVVPIREGLRREFNKVAEQLHLRYGFEYGSELDAEQHVRPLALYLGVQALEERDVDGVRELLEAVDELAAPESEDE